MNSTADSKVHIDAQKIYWPEADRKRRGVTLSVVASPYYMPEEASATLNSKGDLEIAFDYDVPIRSKLKSQDLGDIIVDFECKTGRVGVLTICRESIPDVDQFHLKLEIEKVYQLLKDSGYLQESNHPRENATINRSNLSAAARALKVYASEFSSTVNRTPEPA